MPEASRKLLNLTALRERAWLSIGELASQLGVSVTTIYRLESDQGNPRVGSALLIALELSAYLHKRPSETFQELLASEGLAAVEDIRQRAAEALQKPRTHKGSFKAKRRFRQQAAQADEVERDANEISLVRLQELFASTLFTRTELAELTGLSQRRLGDFFDVNSNNTGSVALWTFLRLAAALAPARDSDVEDTILYLLSDDLKRLDRLFESHSTT